MSVLTTALAEAAGTTELVKVENAVEIFTKGGLTSVLDGIEAKVRAIKLDPATAAGREEIRSTAYKIVRARTTLDAEGKKLTEGWRQGTALVNAERKRSSERLEALADEIRLPLTTFENKEKNRVAAHDQAIADLEKVSNNLQFGAFDSATVETLETAIINWQELHSERDWEEFSDRAKKVRVAVLDGLANKLEARRKFDADQAELERLRAAEAARLQAERDKQLQAEAAERQRLESERIAAEVAAREKQRVEAEAERVRLEAERRAREAQEKIDAAAKALADAEAKAKAEKEAAERRAEQQRVEAKQQAEKAANELKAAQEKAKLEADLAAKREREKIEAERKAEEAARQKREKDKALKAKIHQEMLDDLFPIIANTEITGEAELAEEIATAIMSGKVRNVKVAF